MNDGQHSQSSSSPSSSLETGKSSQNPKRKAGRKIFKETRHPIYHGVRHKKHGKWVCEVREPNKKSRIWLGTYPDPESAAIAHDVAALALRGDSAMLNFPNSARSLPRAGSSSHQDIQTAALQAARDFRPPSLDTTMTSPLSSVVGSEICSAMKLDNDEDTKEMSNGSGLVGFVDEEEMFNMPILLDSMAEGMLLTPLAMKKGFNWSHDDEADDDFSLTLWDDQ